MRELRILNSSQTLGSGYGKRYDSPFIMFNVVIELGLVLRAGLG